MMARSTLETAGQGDEPMPTALRPDEFAAACRAIVEQDEGHEAHRRLDQLVTLLLSSLGYSEGMAIFLAAVAPYHTGEAA